MGNYRILWVGVLRKKDLQLDNKTYFSGRLRSVDSTWFTGEESKGDTGSFDVTPSERCLDWGGRGHMRIFAWEIGLGVPNDQVWTIIRRANWFWVVPASIQETHLHGQNDANRKNPEGYIRWLRLEKEDVCVHLRRYHPPSKSSLRGRQQWGQIPKEKTKQIKQWKSFISMPAFSFPIVPQNCGNMLSVQFR